MRTVTRSGRQSGDRGSSLVEVLVSVGLLSVAAALIAATVLNVAKTSAAGTVRTEAEVEVARLLELVTSQPYRQLADGTIDVPEPCDDDPQFSCVQVNGQTTAVAWHTTGSDERDTTDGTPLWVDVTATAALDNGAEPQPAGSVWECPTTPGVTCLQRTDTATAGTVTGDPNTGSGVVRVHADGADPDTMPGVLLVSGGTTVASASGFDDTGVATLYADADDCDGGCRVALQRPEDASRWWETADGTWTLGAGAIVDDRSVVTPSPAGTTDVAVTLQRTGTITLTVLADPADSDPVAGAEPGSVCLWASFDDTVGPVDQPVCNTTDSGRTITVDRYERDGLQFALPADTDVAVRTTPSDTPDRCPPEPTQPQVVEGAGVWSPGDECTTWTWGEPERVVLADGSTAPTAVPQVGAWTVPAGGTVTGTIIWAGPDAIPAAGPGNSPARAVGALLDGSEPWAHVTFDGDVNDRSGNGNDPSGASGTTFIDGDLLGGFGQSAQMTSSSQVTVGTPAVELVTAEGFFKLDTVTGRQRLLEMSGTVTMWIEVDDGTFELHREGGPWVGAAPASVGTTHHVALVRGQYRTYAVIDGTVAGSWPVTAGTTTQVRFGQGLDGSAGLTGTVDDVAVHLRAVPAQELARRTTAGLGKDVPTRYDQLALDLGATSYYRLDEGRGDIAFDEVGGHDGTYTGTTAGGSSAINDGDGASRWFNGSDHIYVNGIPASATAGTNDAMTYSAWVRTASAAYGDGQENLVFRRQANPGAVHQLRMGPTDLPEFVIRADDGTLFTLQGPDTLPVGQWTHLAGTFDGQRAELFVNGRRVDTIVDAGGLTRNWASSEPMYIGAYSTSARKWVGHIEGAATFDRALTTNEVDALFQAGLGEGPASDWLNHDQLWTFDLNGSMAEEHGGGTRFAGGFADPIAGSTTTTPSQALEYAGQHSSQQNTSLPAERLTSVRYRSKRPYGAATIYRAYDTTSGSNVEAERIIAYDDRVVYQVRDTSNTAHRLEVNVPGLDGGWKHVVVGVTSDGTQVIAVDGQVATQPVPTVLSATTGNAWMRLSGGSAGSTTQVIAYDQLSRSSYFPHPGMVDGLHRPWRGDDSQLQATVDRGAATLLAFDQRPGTTLLTDALGRRGGPLDPLVTTGATDSYDRNGRSARFSTDAGATIYGRDDLAPDDEFTWTLAVKPTAGPSGAWRQIALFGEGAAGSNPNRSPGIWLRPDTMQVHVVTRAMGVVGNRVYVDSIPELSVGRWYDLTVTVAEGQPMRLYIDGQLAGESTDPATGLEAAPDHWLQVGANDRYDGFDGHLDNLAAYMRQMGTDEVADLYLDRRPTPDRNVAWQAPRLARACADSGTCTPPDDIPELACPTGQPTCLSPAQPRPAIEDPTVDVSGDPGIRGLGLVATDPQADTLTVTIDTVPADGQLLTPTTGSYTAVTAGQTFTIDDGYGLLPLSWDRPVGWANNATSFDVTVDDGSGPVATTIILYDDPYLSDLAGTTTLTAPQGGQTTVDIQGRQVDGSDAAGTVVDVTTSSTEVSAPATVTLGPDGAASFDIAVGNATATGHTITVTGPDGITVHTIDLAVTATTGQVQVTGTSDVTQGLSDGSATVLVEDLAGDPQPGVSATAIADPADVRPANRCTTDVNGQCTLTLQADLDADTDTAHTLTADAGGVRSTPGPSFNVVPSARAMTLDPAAVNGAAGQVVGVTTTVTDGAGTPMANTTVKVTAGNAAYTLDDGTINGQSAFTATTDLAGQLTFSVELVGPDGTYDDADAVTLQAGTIARQLPVRIVADASSATMTPTSMPAGTSTAQAVQIVDSGGSGLAGYPYRVDVTGDELTAAADGPTRPDGSGTILLAADRDAAGSYTVTITDAAGTTTLGTTTVTVIGSDRNVTLAGRARQGQTSTVTVTVTHGPDRNPSGSLPVVGPQLVGTEGTPITGATVTGPAETAADGTAAFDLDLPAVGTGPVVLLDVSIDGNAYRLPITVQAGTARIDAGDVQVSEGERRRVAVRVSSQTGDGAAGVPIVADSDTAAVTVTGGITDARGVAPVTIAVPSDGTVPVGSTITVTVTGGSATGTFTATVAPALRPGGITLGSAGPAVDDAPTQVIPAGGNITVDICGTTATGAAAPSGTAVTVDSGHPDLHVTPSVTRLDGTGCVPLTIEADRPTAGGTTVEITVGGTTVGLAVEAT